MDVVTLGDSLLRKRSALVNDIDQGIRDFVGAMFDTLHERKGIGLAAVQLGHLHRIFVTHIPDDIPRAFINPEIIETSLQQGKFEEGCLSIPGVTAEVTRSISVQIQAWNEKGRPFTLRVDGLLARVMQHELDHLNGKLFLDHLSSKKRDRLVKEYDSKVRV